VQAVLPLLNLAGIEVVRRFRRHRRPPGQVVARRTETDEAGVVHHWDDVLAGEAMDQGPVMLNWHDVQDAGATAHQGYNLVIHEFAHKIDLRDGAGRRLPAAALARGRASSGWRRWKRSTRPFAKR
jgi:Mlc titration factor MtfA (ptsG expression regulator)